MTQAMRTWAPTSWGGSSASPCANARSSSTAVRTLRLRVEPNVSTWRSSPPRAGLDEAQVTSLTHGGSSDPCWIDPSDRLLIEAVDQLHETSDLTDGLGGVGRRFRRATAPRPGAARRLVPRASARRQGRLAPPTSLRRHASPTTPPEARTPSTRLAAPRQPRRWRRRRHLVSARTGLSVQSQAPLSMCGPRP